MPRRSSLPYALTLNYLAMMSLAITINLLPVFFTTLQKTLSLSNEQLGRIPAVTFTGLVFAILLTGPLADRLGFKPFAILGNFCIAVGLAILGFAHGYPQILVGSFVMGFGAGTLDMVLSPIVCAFQPNTKTSAMNWLHSFYCLGAVATVLVATVALQTQIHWRHLSLALVIMPLAVGVGFLPLKIPALIATGEVRTRVRDLVFHGFFILAMIAIFLGGATEAGMAQWLPAYAEKSLGFSSWTGGMALLGFSVAMTLGRWLAGLIGTRIAPATLLIACCAASVILFLAASFCPISAIALSACILAGFTGSCLWPTTLAIAADRFPQGGASMFGLLAALGNFGCVFMPWGVGAITDALKNGTPWHIASPLSWGLATAALCPLFMLFAIAAMKRFTPTPTPQNAPATESAAPRPSDADTASLPRT